MVHQEARRSSPGRSKPLHKREDEDKRNRVLRLILLCLVFTLVSTSFLGNSLAKYINTEDAGDSARVAKWGVSINGSGGIFATQYQPHDTETEITLAVVSSSTDRLVAPGTSSADVGSGAGLTIGLTGTPEVACRVTIDTSGSGLAGWDYDLDLEANGGQDTGVEDLYEPIIWKINGNAVPAVLGESDEIIHAEGSFGALLEALGGFSQDYAPGASLSTALPSQTITWEWPFEGDDAGDTYYGNRAAEGYAPTVTLVLTITVTQID